MPEVQSHEPLLDDLSEGKLSIEEATKLFAKKNQAPEVDEGIVDLRKLLGQYDFKFLDDRETQRLQTKLDSQNEGTRQEARAEIQARATNVREYMTKLNKGDNIQLIDGTAINLFNIDSATGEDQKQSYIDAFISLPLEKQVSWLEKVGQDIDQRVKQFNKLVDLVGKESKEDEIAKFKKLRTRERKDYLGQLEEVNRKYDELLRTSKAGSAEKRKRLVAFREMGLEGKKIEFARLREALSVPQKDKEFESAKKQRRKNHPEFYTLDDNEKETILKAIREEIATEYLKELDNCPHLSNADLKLMKPTVRGRFDIKLAEDCLDYLPKTLKIAEEADLEGEKYDSKVLKHFDWNNITSLDRRELIKTGKLKEYSENLDHVKYDEKYKKKLDKYLKHDEFGLITKKAHEEYYKWFQDLELKRKQDIVDNAEKNKSLDYLEQTLKQRKKLNKQFKELPTAVQKEFKAEYKEMGFEERMNLLFFINKETIKLNKKFDEKLDELIRDHLVSQKSQKAYVEWFAELSISEKIKYLEQSDLDKPERKTVLKVFETKVIENAPAKDHKKLRDTFLDADLDKRKLLIKQWLKKYSPTQDSSLDEALMSMKTDKGLEKLTELDTASELFLNHAEKAEKEGKYQDALTFYRAILEGETELDKEFKKDIEKRIERLEADLDNYDDEIEQGHFSEVLEHNLQQVLEDPTLADEQEKLTIFEELYEIQWRNELLFRKQPTAQKQMEKTIAGEESTVIELSEALAEHTDGDQAITKEADGTLSVAKEKEFNSQRFDEKAESYEKWRNYVAEMQAHPQERRWDASLKLINPNTHQELTADQYRDQVLGKQRATFEQKARAKLMKRLNLNRESTSTTTLKAIDDHIKKKDFKKKLERRNKKTRK